MNFRTGITAQGNNFEIENVLGNTQIAYTLPAGINKTIGAKEDELTSTITYFNYNDQNNHTILQYSWVTNQIQRVAQGIALGFDINHKITGINIIQNADGSYSIYWTDNFSEPHKINFTHAIAGTGAYAPYNAATGDGVDQANTFTPGQLNLKEYIYAIKTPPLYPPTPYYFTDNTRNSNYLNGFLWQFQYRFYFDDNEKSAFSPISVVPLPQLDSSILTDTFTNNEIQIIVNTGTAIVTKIEIAARQANGSPTVPGNSQPFQSIIVLTKADPYNPIADNTNYTFQFYNDGVYSLVPTPESISLFDNIPQLAAAQELIEPTRMAYGNGLDGYDQTPVVAELGVSFPAKANNLFNLVCNDVTIINPYCNQSFQGGVINGVQSRPAQNGINLQCQPIWASYDSINNKNVNQSGAIFGGFPSDGVSYTPTYNVPQIIKSYNQTLPLGGFVFYLAGTNNYGISAQHVVSRGNNHFSQDQTTGEYILANGDQPSYNDLSTYIQANQVYSKVTVSNITVGTYLLRIADHNTLASDLVDPGLGYQKRSTYTIMINGVAAKEATISITSSVVSGIITYQAKVNGVVTAIDPITGNIQINSCVILDMSLYESGGTTFMNAMTGYLLDHDTTLPASPTDFNYLAETRVDLAKVVLYGASSIFTSNIPTSILPNWNPDTPSTVYSDYNGFFFYGRAYSGNGAASVTISSIASGVIPCTTFTYASQSGSFRGPGAENQRVFVRTPTQGFFDDSRTILSLNIREIIGSNNINLADISAVVTRGGFGISNVNGIATIVIYADTASGTATRRGNIYFTTEDDTFFDSYSPVFGNNGFAIGQTGYYDFFNINFGLPGVITNPNLPPSPLNLSPYTGVYNYQFVINLVNVLANLSGKNPATSSLKRGGTYQYGLVYYDHANRSGTTNTNDYASSNTVFSGKNSLYGLKLYVPFYTEINPSTNLVYGGSAPAVNWSIFHQPPSFATHYQWVRTKDSALNSWLQFVANSVKYLDVNGNQVAFGSSSAVKIELDISNITTFDANNPTTLLNYDWVQKPTDDHVRLIRDNNGNFYTGYIDTLVIGGPDTANPKMKILIENTPSINIDISQQPGLLFEVYNPKLQLPVNETLFWEIGECYPIGKDAATGKLYHTGNGGINPTTLVPYPAGTFGNQSVDYTAKALNLNPAATSTQIKTSTTPAIGIFIGGDMYYRTRNMAFTTTTGQGSTKTYVIEDASVSDFYQSQASDIGRPNRYDPDARQLRRFSTIWYSELFLPETNINGLNTVYDTSFYDYEQKYGPINKLYNENHRLIVFQQLKVGQVPINQAMVYDQNNNQQLVYTEQVLNDIIYYAGEFGMTNAESFAVFGTDKYFLDVNRLKPLRLADDGVKPIDENDSRQIKMHIYWSNRLAQYKGASNVFMYGVWDKKFGNYIVAMEQITSSNISSQNGVASGLGSSFSLGGVPVGGLSVGGSPSQPTIILPAETIAWDERSNRWKEKLSFHPDFMCQYKDNIVSFQNGQLYVHNSGTQYSTFYGVTTPPEIDVVANMNPSKQKTLMAISEESSTILECAISTEENQLTHAIATDFALIENVYYAPAFKDENSPNVANPAIEGDILRSSNFLVRATVPLANAVNFCKVFAISVLCSDSERSGR